MRSYPFLFRAVVSSFCLLTLNIALAQDITRVEYIDQYKGIAIEEMIRSGIPASITMAQGLLESDNGNSSLAKKANNHFGIKCHSSWKGKTYHQDDDTKNECFRKYKSANESYIDHSNFLMTGKRYTFLFELEKTDYKGWAEGLKKAGYATNAKYPALLIKIIEDNNLQLLDALDSLEVQLPEQTEKPVKNRKTRRNKNAKKGNETKLEDVDNYSFGLATREIKENNGIKYIVAKKGDSFYRISTDLQLMLRELYKYNDLDKGAVLKENQILYIQPKRNRAAPGIETHVLIPGEDLYTVSQKYGIKMRQLLKKNNLKNVNELKVGDEVWLRKRKPS